MRSLSVFVIVLVLGCMQMFSFVTSDWNGAEHFDSIEQVGKDVKITASLSRSGIYATLSTKMKNKKDILSGLHPSTGMNMSLPVSSFFYVNTDFICAVFLNLFPRKYQSNYLSS
ncbi:hypothetical protein FZC74_07640 [Sutcliffiella horikoshii]|uniref:Uncharacterized protein n=1 Tax=Sutcliffiella horikoshii TaxID=79883 RepID=A0AA94WUB5_9BACI|nr:hypothetical protein [Sutcliffiella horikoshii]TYS60015.1 hypothetical protein FZC74_07640 [Sutcliffiella horikoshii]